jgi:hypothetical protein
MFGCGLPGTTPRRCSDRFPNGSLKIVASGEKEDKPLAA